MKIGEEQAIYLVRVLTRAKDQTLSNIRSLEKDPQLNKRKAKELVKEEKFCVRTLELALDSLLGKEG